MRFPSPVRITSAVAVLLTAPALAQAPLVLGFEGQVRADGVPAPWQFERWSPMVGLGDFVAEARVVTPDGPGAPHGPVLAVRCQEAGFMVGSERDIDLSERPWASWSWRADTLPTGASFRARETNDQVLQLLFGFEGGEVLGYVWDSTGTVGASGSGLSWREDVRVMVLRVGPGAPGAWVGERRDIVADFRTLFGHAPPGPLKGLAVQSNCQHTASSGLGAIGAITLSPG